MRILLKVGQQPDLAHHLDKTRHEDLTAVFALEIVVGFQDQDLDALVGQQERKNHPRRPGPDDADINSVNLLRHIPQRLTAALVFRQTFLDISACILDVFANPFDGFTPDHRENKSTSYNGENNLTHDSPPVIFLIPYFEGNDEARP